MAGGDSAGSRVGSREEARRRSFLEAAAKAGLGQVLKGDLTHPFPAHSNSPTWHLSKALWMSRLLPLLMIRMRLQNPNAVASSLKGRAWGAQGGVIVHSRKRSCIQHMPSSHQGLKLSFLGQFLSPSCNIPGIFLALLGPERLREVHAVVRAAQPIGSGDCSRRNIQKAQQTQLQLSGFSEGKKIKAGYSLYEGPSSKHFLAWLEAHHKPLCFSTS